jgi:hypothetical protein
MTAADRAKLQAALGADWLVSDRVVAPPGHLRLFDYDRTLYVIEAKDKPYRWVLWDGRGDFLGGDAPVDVETMAAELRAFVGEPMTKGEGQ